MDEIGEIEPGGESEPGGQIEPRPGEDEARARGERRAAVIRSLLYALLALAVVLLVLSQVLLALKVDELGKLVKAQTREIEALKRRPQVLGAKAPAPEVEDLRVQLKLIEGELATTQDGLARIGSDLSDVKLEVAGVESGVRRVSVRGIETELGRLSKNFEDLSARLDSIERALREVGVDP